MRSPQDLRALSGGVTGGLIAAVVTGMAVHSGVVLASGGTVVLPGWALLVLASTLGGAIGALGARQGIRGELDRMERQMNRMRVDHDAVLDHLASGLLVVDDRGVVTFVNPAATQVLGLVAADVTGCHVSKALPERVGALGALVLEALRMQQGRARADLDLQTATGQALPLGATTNVLMHEGQVTGVVTVFQDLTAVREMEQRVRRTETLAEVGALAAGIAHELRNGLKPIAGSIEYLQREMAPEGEVGELMDLIARESNRLNRFVTDLLSYAREREVYTEAMDLEAMLRETFAVLEHDPRRLATHALAIEGGASAVTVAIDREQMRQVWLNLAVNGLEAMPDGGTLHVRWHVAGGAVVVELQDEGPGIAAEDLPRIGEPFFTTKRGGTGLGLAIAQRIVERHSGVLTLDSLAGHGTTVRVQLPVQAGTEAQAA